MITIPILQLSHASGLPLPAYATEGSAGMDLLAAVETPIILPSMERILVPTGISIALPVGFEAQVRPRSGLALKSGLTVLNAPGTIDSDYRGEIQVILANLSKESFAIERGARIAQIVIARVERASWKIAEALDETLRAAGGFGSTGVHTKIKETA